MGRSREVDLEALCSGMRAPTDDEIPRALDGTPLDTKEKLLAYLAEVNRSGDEARAG